MEFNMQLFKPTTLSAAILAASMSAAHADVNVVASIKPVHSLVAGVMQGVGTHPRPDSYKMLISYFG
jgi:ABC-type Zn2+ transport system substrate-binding protein/surface adhesin